MSGPYFVNWRYLNRVLIYVHYSKQDCWNTRTTYRGWSATRVTRVFSESRVDNSGWVMWKSRFTILSDTFMYLYVLVISSSRNEQFNVSEKNKNKNNFRRGYIKFCEKTGSFLSCHLYFIRDLTKTTTLRRSEYKVCLGEVVCLRTCSGYGPTDLGCLRRRCGTSLWREDLIKNSSRRTH